MVYEEEEEKLYSQNWIFAQICDVYVLSPEDKYRYRACVYMGDFK